MCLLWWSWLFRQGTASSEALFCSCSWLMKPPAVLAPDLEFFPGGTQRPSNNRGTSIKQGCGQGHSVFMLHFAGFNDHTCKSGEYFHLYSNKLNYKPCAFICLSNFTFLSLPKTYSKTSLRHRMLHWTFQSATPQETLADWLLVPSITKNATEQ